MSPTSDLLSRTLAHADFHPKLPQQRRLYEAAKAAIHEQILKPDTKLPSSRDLARDLGIARNTVIAAFEQLAAEGYVRSAMGSGTYVADLEAHREHMGGKRLSETPLLSDAPPETLLSRRGEELAAFGAGQRHEIQPFAPGEDFSSFPFKLWVRLQNRVWRDPQPEMLDYGQHGGYLPLRQAIVEYLRLSRSVNATVDQVMITAGTQQSLDLCARLLADVGDTAWMEDPNYWGARRIFQACNLNIHPVPVDAEGMAIRPADLQTRPRLIYVTPSHQYPTGVVMSLIRRRQLLDVAAQQKAWILEDDYDSEFRYTGRPLAALKGLDSQQRVIYMGTFSKVLFPGIKVGYIVTPPALSASFKRALYDLQRPGQLMVQATLADFMALGHFTTHLRKLRQTYGARREMLRRTLLTHLSTHVKQKVRISAEESGLHLVLELPDDFDDVGLCALAAASGMRVSALSTYYLQAPPKRGLLIGYAYVLPEKISYYGKLLAAIIDAGVR